MNLFENNNIKLVDCSQEYWEFVRLLRMDDRVIEGFIKSEAITPNDQIKYMEKYSDNYRVVIFNDKPAGYVGVIDNDIRICTHPDFQRKNLGRFMINEALKIWPNAFAKIKLNNQVSIDFFESCGFKKKYYILEK